MSTYKFLKMTNYLHNNVAGVIIHDDIRRRMEKAGDRAEEEGVAIAVELIEKIKSRNLVNGIHMMAIGWEAIIPTILENAGLAKKSILTLN